ncbi:glycosyltransferase family 4 protein, partial [Planctomycetota bacterium]
VFKPIWRNAAVLVACSEGLRDRALRFLPTVDVQVIPNGVDLKRFHVRPERRSLSAGSCQLLTVGRLSSTKRVDLLIRALGRLHKENCPVHLTVVGGGSLEQTLRDQIQAADLSDQVTLLGRVEREDMPEIYGSHDILVSATLQEGMSNAMLEAMASGLPILTTPCEGVDELVSDNGIVLDEATDEAMAEAVTALVSDPTRYARMAQQARVRAEAFTWKAVADQYCNCYQTVLDGGSR